MSGCDGDGNVGVGGGDVVVMSAGTWVVHMIQVLWLVQLTC